jgi:hypothetical protein
MKKIYLLFSLNCFGLLLSAQTPITLGNSNMPGSGDTLRYTNAQINSVGNYTQTGANFNWNFHSLVSTTEGVRSYKSALQTPYAFYFLSLNEYGEKIADTLGAGPLTITKYWNFYKKQTTPVNAFVADGSGMTFSSIPVPSYYSDKDELYNFPMTYPKYDSTTFAFSTLGSSLIPITYSKKGYRVTKVDGWGKVITPYDTANCLRLVTTQYAMDTIKTTFGGFTIPVGFPNYQRSYQWLTTTSKIPFLEITGNLVGANFTITQVKYRGYKRDAVIPPPPPPPPVDTGIDEQQAAGKIQVYPNPVKDKILLNYNTTESYVVEIFDIKGKRLKQELIEPNGQAQSIDVSAFANGLYLIKATQNKNVSCFKFMKVVD